MKGKLIALTLIAAPLVGFMATKTLPLEPSSTLTVEGTSTVRGWKCAAKKLDAAIVAETSADLSGFVQNAAVIIPVAQLDCGNGKMNEHMRKALLAEKNADIKFTLNSYELKGNNADLKGSLQIAGQTQPITIPATVTEEGANVVKVKAAKQIDMRQWGVKPPSLMMGTMKVKELVTVNFDVSIKR